MDTKEIHTVLLDAGPIIRGVPPISSLLQKAERIVTLPSVLEEVRDEAARTRLKTTYLPFLNVQSPSSESIRVVTDFARRTGDLAVLAKTDLQVLALAYELECERNAGDWRLRKVPGQKRTNGPPPKELLREDVAEEGGLAVQPPLSTPHEDGGGRISGSDESLEGAEVAQLDDHPTDLSTRASMAVGDQLVNDAAKQATSQDFESEPPPLREPDPDQVDAEQVEEQLEGTTLQEDDDSDSEGWITPSNLAKHQSKNAAAGNPLQSNTDQPIMQVATITSDFAMQNVLLQMNLNLLSPTLQRVRHIKTFVLRCHACFQVVKDMAKQFCPRCGKPTLTRVACSTNQNGEFTLHLKRNMTWNKRGDKYSIPKPVHGSSHGRVQGGGKDSWGSSLLLAEDQKEYVRATEQERRQKHRDIMDEDYLPSILSGDRNKATGRPKIGAGRSVNSRRRY